MFTDYIENTYELRDFFSNDTLIELKTSSLYSVKEMRSMFFGRCYKICSIAELQVNGFKRWELKTDFNCKLYVHNDGDEFWLISGITYLIDMSQTTIDINRTDGIKAGLMFEAF